jgi:hypothetical protein
MAQLEIQFPDNSIVDRMCSSAMALKASKLIRHQSVDVEAFGPSTTVVALTRDIHIVRGAAGTLVGLQAAICGAIATGADRTVTVDLQKSTGAGAFATVLSSTIGFTNASVLRTALSAVFSSTSLVAGDILRLVITVAGAAGAQATGLLVTLTMEETYA